MGDVRVVSWGLELLHLGCIGKYCCLPLQVAKMDWKESVQLVFDYFCERTPRCCTSPPASPCYPAAFASPFIAQSNLSGRALVSVLAPSCPSNVRCPGDICLPSNSRHCLPWEACMPRELQDGSQRMYKIFYRADGCVRLVGTVGGACPSPLWS